MEEQMWIYMMQEVTYIRNFLLHKANKQTYCVWNTVFSLWKKDDVNVKHGKKRGEKKHVVVCSMWGININLKLFCQSIFLVMFPEVCYKMLCTHANLFQSCPTLCKPMDCSPPGSSVHGILQTRILERTAIPSCKGSSWPRDPTPVSCPGDRFFTATLAKSIKCY